MLATRPELQVAADWMLVPSARNLHWRYEVLHSAFIVCKQRLGAEDDRQENLKQLLAATKRIWESISTNTVTMKGMKRPINGHLELLFHDDKMDELGKLVLKSYLNTTRHIAGCQAIRKKIGHLLFGFRVCYGEALFVTASPNRRHSGLLLTLSRARQNDTGLMRKDGTAQWRSRYCGAKKPGFYSNFDVDMDPAGEQASVEVPMPNLLERQAWNAQDPLASIHHYDIVMYILLAATFGVRMCLRCPHCNIDSTDPNRRVHFLGCCDLLGCNNKLMGGFAGIAQALIFANELQGEGTPHGHGFVVLANVFQHSTLLEIAAMLEHNKSLTQPMDIVERVKAFCNHVQRESHIDEERHAADATKLEKGFHHANDERLDSANIFLSLRPKTLFSNRTLCCAWNNASEAEVMADAATFNRKFHAHVQFIFSRVQHHWHAKNEKGERIPLPYCRNRYAKGKQNVCCKQSYPRHVVSKHRQKTRLVCRGVAAELRLKVSGRRNMLGSIASIRNDAWFASTAAILACVTQSNTNIQCPYRLPINSNTHDSDCQVAGCFREADVKHLYRLTQRLMKQISGYFGGYISKKQKTGQYELKKSIGALPLLQEKLERRDLKSPSHVLAHVVNRMFTVLESKGILRTGTEEFALAAKYHPEDALAAECIRTCRSEPFYGRDFLIRVESVARGDKKIEMRTLLPEAKHGTPPLDRVSMYGFRPRVPDLWYLSPWEFTQWFICHKLRPQAKNIPSRGLQKRVEEKCLLRVQFS